MHRSEQVALYLNAVATHLGETAGKLDKLVAGNKTITFSTGRNEETQCLSVDGALWIANNDDADTNSQQAFLNAIGINNYDKLVEYIDQYQSLVLPSTKNSATLTMESLSPKKRLLYELATADGKNNLLTMQQLPQLPANPVSNPSYSLASNDPPPAPKKLGTTWSNILFVKGSFDGKKTKAGSEHAEQKLLAALSRCTDRAFGKGVKVFGCKMACAVCETVLESAARKLSARGATLKYVDSVVDDLRNSDKVKLRKANPDGIKDLDVDAYFG